MTVDSYYANLADKRERDPVVIPGEHGRADVANGRMSKWQRMNPTQQLVSILDFEGTVRYLTPTQHRVLSLLRRLADTGQRITLTHIARLLSVSPSTVSRSMVRFASFGLIVYQTNRGRNGGAIFITWKPTASLAAFREAAKEKVRKWAKASAERFSRLYANLAPYSNDPRMVSIYSPTSPSYLGRKISTEWSWDEVNEALR